MHKHIVVRIVVAVVILVVVFGVVADLNMRFATTGGPVVVGSSTLDGLSEAEHYKREVAALRAARDRERARTQTAANNIGLSLAAVREDHRKLTAELAQLQRDWWRAVLDGERIFEERTCAVEEAERLRAELAVVERDRDRAEAALRRERDRQAAQEARLRELGAVVGAALRAVCGLR